MVNRFFYVVATTFIIFVSLSAGSSNTKILVMTPAYNQPEFIRMQYRSFKKFLQDDYEFMVFNDASDEQMSQQIVSMCFSLNIPCVRVPQENRAIFTWASYRHGQSIEFMMRTVGNNYPGIVALIDSDMFLVKKFKITNYLNGYDIAGIRHGVRDSTTEFMWPGLMFFDMRSLPNKDTMLFAPIEKGKVKLDTGGSLYKYFQENLSVKKLFFKQEARLILDEDLYPRYHFACPFYERYPKCFACTKTAAEKCAHKAVLLKQLGFSQKVIDIILAKNIACRTEFLLGDTFYHAVGSSGYGTMTPEKRHEKHARVIKFVNDMIGSV